MDTSTPFFINETYDLYIEPSPVNKSAQVGCWTTFIILACILNAVVITGIVCLYVKQPAVRTGLPKLGVILVCCVLQIVDVGLSGVGVHVTRVTAQELKSDFTCGNLVGAELANFVLLPVVNLVVGAVVVLEGLRMQKFVSLSPGIHLAAAVTLTVSAFLYGLAVVIPVFYFRYLEDEKNPCRPDEVYHIVDSDSYRDIYITTFIVPHCLVLMACLLLLVAYFTRQYASRSAEETHSCPAPASYPSSGPGAYPHSTFSATGTVSSHPGQPPVHPPNNPYGTQYQTGEQSSPFPWPVLLAAAVSFVFGFVFFLQAYADLDLPFSDARRLWAASVLLLALKGVFLPCCWLLDSQVRAQWSCCRCPRPSGGFDRFPPEGGKEMADMARV